MIETTKIEATKESAETGAVGRLRQMVGRHGLRFFRFALVGFSGMLVNTGVLYGLVEIGQLNHLIAAAMATEVAILSNFTLNDRWTFRRVEAKVSWVNRLWRYNLVALGGMLISLVVLAALTYLFHFYYLLANLFAIGAGLVWNYIANSLFTWSNRLFLSQKDL